MLTAEETRHEAGWSEHYRFSAHGSRRELPPCANASSQAALRRHANYRSSARRLRAARRGSEEHGTRRLQRPAGTQRLSAGDTEPERPLDRLCRTSRRHGGHTQAGECAHRPARIQRHVDHRRHRPEAAEIPLSHPGRGRPRRRRRRADGARVPRQGSAQGRSEQVLHAARVRQFRARGVGCDRPGRAQTPGPDRRHQRHAQEFLGMRYRHRLSRLRRGRLAHAAHDADL